MFSFFNRKKKSLPAPDWTSFTSLYDFEKFIGVVKSYFDGKRLAFTREDDLLIVRDPRWKAERMGLSNLAQICKQSPASEWKQIVAVHFDGLHRSMDFQREFLAKAHDYAYAAPYIGVRVYPRNYVEHIGDEVTIKHSIADDLVAMLVFDFPQTVSNIKPETTIQWNKTNEELYDIGLANIRHKYPWQVNSELISGMRIWFIEGEDLFVANSVLVMHLLSIPYSIYGSLVAIPNRHTVIVYPIENLEVISVLQPFIAILQGLYKDGPGSISSSLYWYRDGELSILPYEIGGDALNFKPTEEFIEVLNQLEKKS